MSSFLLPYKILDIKKRNVFNKTNSTDEPTNQSVRRYSY